MIWRIEIETDNAAFEEWPATELGRILIELGHHLQRTNEIEAGPIWDVNGNRVGFIDIVVEADDD